MQNPFFSNLMLRPMSAPPLQRTVDPILLMRKGGTLIAIDSCWVDIHSTVPCTTLCPKKSCSNLTFGVRTISTSTILPPSGCPTTTAVVPVRGFCITTTSLPTGNSSSRASAAFFSECRASSCVGSCEASCRGYRRVSPSNTFLSSPRAFLTMPDSTTTSSMTWTSPTSSPLFVMQTSLSILLSLIHLSACSGEWFVVLTCPSRCVMRHSLSLTALIWHSRRYGHPT
mmetsp:Transcript_3077/g.7079  ORF Transcript_3077/g.7079 Transcript_3077/m.7079 type:complete len:227 (-) Transcript_3077:904-1584(-)